MASSSTFCPQIQDAGVRLNKVKTFYLVLKVRKLVAFEFEVVLAFAETITIVALKAAKPEILIRFFHKSL